MSKAYSEGGERHQVLDNVDLAIPRGASVAVRGRSGSGKSTLLNLIGLLDRPSAGTYVLDGRDVTQLDEVQQARVRRASTAACRISSSHARC